MANTLYLINVFNHINSAATHVKRNEPILHVTNK